ncbi:hypothetical protein BT67DRAFT_293995 [Trichocladium antarcticum]|uniref:Uncharacterized protein n=1 Tax=Trichocladium antarcticum TaxID=1450529 RepID=A0AAN6UM35_9PEZI|nr:hypothetical protein BT67DRAFT_293995 [Trichocladium antarcticum]
MRKAKVRAGGGNPWIRGTCLTTMLVPVLWEHFQLRRAFHCRVACTWRGQYIRTRIAGEPNVPLQQVATKQR